MIRLDAAIAAWGSPDFKNVLQAELMRADALTAPMQQGLARGSLALAAGAELLLLQRLEDADTLTVKAGICYLSTIPGCACENDPTPMGELPEYIELLISIDRRSGEATIRLLED